jgi:WD40 repeat protein
MQTNQGVKGLRVLLAAAIVSGSVGQQGLGQEVKPWTTLTGRMTEPVLSLAFSPDSKLLASVGNDQSAKLWDVQNRRERAALKNPSGAAAVAFGPDGRLLAAGGRIGVVRLWDATGRTRGTLDGPHRKVNCLAFSPDSTTLAVGGGWDAKRGQLRLWNVRTGYARLALCGHTGFVIDVAFSEDGRMLAAGDAAGVLTVWEVASGKVRASLRGHRGGVYSVVFVHSSLLAAGGEDGTVRFWDLRSGKQRAALSDHDGSIFHLATAGKLLASAGQDGIVRLWDTTTRKQLLPLKVGGWAFSVAFSPDGKLLAAGDEKGTIRLWRVPKLLAHAGKK